MWTGALDQLPPHFIYRKYNYIHGLSPFEDYDFILDHINLEVGFGKDIPNRVDLGHNANLHIEKINKKSI